jgi:hypothetical protein
VIVSRDLPIRFRLHQFDLPQRIGVELAETADFGYESPHQTIIVIGPVPV